MTIQHLIPQSHPSANDPKREDPMLTTISVKKDTESCVIAKPSIMGNTHNQQDHTVNLKGSTQKQRTILERNLNDITEILDKSLEENLAENGTSLGTTTSAQHRNHTDKVDAQANEQGTIITTVKVLEPTKITKTITYEDNHKEGIIQENPSFLEPKNFKIEDKCSTKIIEEFHASRPTKLDLIETSPRL